MKNKTKQISVCMGSSCFARGNNKNLIFLESYIKENPGTLSLDLYGTRCKNQCSQGPILRIGNKTYTRVTLKNLKDILNTLTSEKQKENIHEQPIPGLHA